MNEEVSECDLFEGLPELSARSHAELLCDVSGDFQQENLHQARHQSILTHTHTHTQLVNTDIILYKKCLIIH